MRIGVSNLGVLRRPFRHVEKLVEALDGLSVLEVVDDLPYPLTRDRISFLKGLASSYGLTLVVHAPFNNLNACAVNRSFRALSMKLLNKCFERAGALGSELVVVHLGLDSPISLFKPKVVWDICFKSASRLIELGRDCGVTVAFENSTGEAGLLKNVEEVRRLAERVDGVKLSFDVGHANTVGQTKEFLEKFLHLMVHAHVHDNDGFRDLHLPVGEGTIDWRFVLPLLAKMRGPVVIEPMDFEGAIKSYRRIRELASSLNFINC